MPDKTLARIAVFFRATRRTNIRVEHMQMRWLVFVVADGSVIYVRHFIESRFAVELQITVTLLVVVARIAVV
jgi:hypothetical protein